MGSALAGETVRFSGSAISAGEDVVETAIPASQMSVRSDSPGFLWEGCR